MLGAETTVVLPEPFWVEPNSIDATGSSSKQGIGSIEDFATLVHNSDCSCGVWLEFSFSGGWIIAVPKPLGC